MTNHIYLATQCAEDAYAILEEAFGDPVTTNYDGALHELAYQMFLEQAIEPGVEDIADAEEAIFERIWELTAIPE